MTIESPSEYRMDLKRFAADPLSFFQELVIPAANGSSKFADVMGDFQREWFAAIAPALLAVANGKRPKVGRFWTERTKGGSKDTDAACALLWLLAFSKRRLDMQVGASDKDQALELKKAATDTIRLNSWLSARIEAQSWSLLCRATGSECTIISSDVASSHGARPDVVVINELSHIQKEEFASNLMDNASKKPQGLVIVASNAGFTDTWQHRWRETFRHSDRWHYHAFSQPAPWLSEAEVEEARRRNSNARFMRLFWGQWLSQAGDALDEAVVAAAVKADLRPLSRAEAGYSYVLGVDASVSRHHTALVVLGIRRSHAGHGMIRLAAVKVWRPTPGNRVDLAQVEQAIVDYDSAFDLDQIAYDPYELRYLASRLQAGKVGRMAGETRFGSRRRERLPMVEVSPTGKNLTAMATAVLEAFNDYRVTLYDEPALIRDVRAFKLEEKSYGIRLASPEMADGSHGDVGSAFALACLAGSELSSRRIVRVGPLGGGGADGDWQQAVRRARAASDLFDRMQRQHQGEDPNSLETAIRDRAPITIRQLGD